MTKNFGMEPVEKKNYSQTILTVVCFVLVVAGGAWYYMQNRDELKTAAPIEQVKNLPTVASMAPEYVVALQIVTSGKMKPYEIYEKSVKGYRNEKTGIYVAFSPYPLVLSIACDERVSCDLTINGREDFPESDFPCSCREKAYLVKIEHKK